MSETAESLITDALGGLFAVGAEQPVEAVDMALGIRFLNRLMSSLDAQGISLGYTTVKSPSDPITVNPGAIMGMVDNLSLMLADQYGALITGTLQQNASNGLKAMRKIAVVIKPTQMPCTLPIGSGNEGDYFNYDHFYACPEEEVLNEQGGSINLESET